MEIQQQVTTATVVCNAIEIASGILRGLDGNSISSSADGPRDIEQDVAVYINSQLQAGRTALVDTALQEVNNAS